MFIAEVPLGQAVRVLKRVNKEDRERECGAHEQDANIHQVQTVTDAGGQAFVRQLGDGGQAKQAEDEQNRAEGDVHVVGDQVDHPVEHLTILVENHERYGEQKTDRSRVDGVAGKDDSHADLGFEARLEDRGV